MISKWKNTYVEHAAEMLYVEDLLEWSKGEIRELSEENVEIGHITLPAPIINVQYLCGRRPILSGMLGLSLNETKNIVYYSSHINVNKNSTDYKKMITWKEFQEHEDKDDYKTGAEAIRALLPDATNIVLTYIPVLPFDVRYIKKGDCYKETGINILCEKIIWRKDRLTRMMELAVPDIILMNEKRMLQVLVDGLINNGAASEPLMDYNGVPYESLDYLYQIITKPERPAHYEMDEDFKLDDRMRNILKVYTKKFDENEPTDDLEDEFFEYVKPYAERIIDKYFKDYSDYDLLPHARYSVVHMMLEVPDKDMIVNGIGKTIENFVQKRTKFTEV